MKKRPDNTPAQVLRGRVERVTYASSETGYAVLRVKPVRGAMFTATGHVAELADNAGLDGVEFDFTGKWGMTRYGRQFAFTECRMIGSELLFFLSKVVKGLGQKMAAHLIEKYGEKRLVDILDNNPEELLKVKGIKEKRLALIKKSWHKHRNLKRLAEYIGSSGSGITPNLLIRIYNHFEDDALDVIRENPYCLTEVRGIGFKRADSIALALGLDEASPERIKAAISHLLVEAAESNGHCFVMRSKLYSMLAELLSSDTFSPDPEKVEGIITSMILAGDLVSDQGKRLGLSSYRYMEDWIREFFRERSQECDRAVVSSEEIRLFLDSYEEKLGFLLADEQKEIVRKVAREPRMIFGLAGYAGTGKTTICAAILDLLSSCYADRDDVVCCAFTGMASSRLRKTTGYEALTIHSLLKYRGNNEFEHGPDNPLPQRVVVLDEASMVSLPLFYRLARALKPSTLFILVGDPAQLPPIGAGNVFADALSGRLIPAVQLEKIYRQSEESVLTLFANEIRRGVVPEGAANRNWLDFRFEKVEKHNIWAAKREKSEAELRILREENNQAILDRILEIVREKAGSLTHPVWDFQVLTPMRIGQLGTEVFNRELQAILNPEGNGRWFSRSGLVIREKDKVVHLQNRDMEIMSWDDFLKNGKHFNGDGTTRRIFNGNTGLVMKIDREAEQFYVVYPERIVAAYDFDHLGDIIELAYALTVHKAQGSQYKLVAIPMTNSHFIMLNNKWFYTAITRAEKKVYLVGQEYAFKRACTNIEGVRRQTWLGLEQVEEG